MRLFSKGVPGLDNKGLSDWREGRLDFVTCQIRPTAGGPLNCIICMHIFKPCLFTNVSDFPKAFGRERQTPSVHARCVLFCVNSAQALFCLWHAQAAWTGTPHEVCLTSPLWQVTLAIIHLYWIYTLEYRCTDQQGYLFVLFRASSVPLPAHKLHWSALGRGTQSVSTNHAENGTSDKCSHDCVKQ